MDILSVISQEVKSIFSEVVNDVSVPAETLEVEVLRASRELGRKVLEACFSAKASAVASPAPVCQKCSGELVGFQQRQRYVETLCGVVRISRWVYRCECGSYGVPWDAEVGLKAGCTIGVRKAMCRLSARLDFREACEELWHQGLRVSHTRLQQKVQEWSEGERVSDSVDEQALEVGSRWYVSADGCHTPAQDGTYSEVKVGCVYRDYPQLGPGSIASARSSSLRYVASRSDAVSFGEQWFALATASGIYHKETPDEEIVVIGDGAAWIWNLSEQYFPGATEIVDYMHAKSHLYDIAKQAFGETSPETIERWVKTMETSLYSGDTQDLVAGIRALGVGIPALSEALETEVGYFQKHAKRMQYQTFVENGYHIGSGLIESACKHVVAQRCKQASMKWSKPGIDAVLFWRCLLKNGAWDEFWDKQAKTA
jgi:hypothetical protein